MKNSERIGRFATVLVVEYEDTTAHEAIVDLLSDCRHFCAKYGVQFDEVVDTSRLHFEEEAEIDN